MSKIMMLKISGALALLMVTTPLRANILVEYSFQRKMDASDLVIVGIVTSVHAPSAGGYDGTATVRPLATLKGVPQAEIIVQTQDIIPEADPRCCQTGASYVMFLRQAGDGSGLISVNGRFGMIRVAPARNDPELEVIREPTR
jgi:hypothetical protein